MNLKNLWTVYKMVQQKEKATGFNLSKEEQDLKNFVVEAISGEMEKAMRAVDYGWQTLANEGRKVPAIKLHRDFYGTSLYDSKCAVEAFMNSPSYLPRHGN